MLLNKLFIVKNMKRGFLFVLLSAAVGGLTAFAVVKSMSEGQAASQMSETALVRTVTLSHETWPDFKKSVAVRES